MIVKRAASHRNWVEDRLVYPVTVDRFPPNPLGLHDMSDNGLEWVEDWYDPHYYANSPFHDPQGPDEPSRKNYYGKYTKVLRGQVTANPLWGGVNVLRKFVSPDGVDDFLGYPNLSTARCVVDYPERINK
ncbi:formylglycine-generating enzyme family protein [Pseudomonas sp. X10]